jgi:hypothetical protein
MTTALTISTAGPAFACAGAQCRARARHAGGASKLARTPEPAIEAAGRLPAATLEGGWARPSRLRWVDSLVTLAVLGWFAVAIAQMAGEWRGARAGERAVPPPVAETAHGQGPRANPAPEGSGAGLPRLL